MTKFTSWSPSRLADYEACPLGAKFKHLDKLCPACFKGRLMGGFDRLAVCKDCGKEQVPGPALVRGSRIGKSLEDYVTGASAALDLEIKNPEVKEIALGFRADFKRGKVSVERQFIFNDKWELLQGDFPEGAWLRAKLDVLEENKNLRHLTVVDWKTGGIDKRTGQIRASDKYDDQLSLYCVAALAGVPESREASAALVFVDAPAGVEPVVAKENLDLQRKGLKAAQKKWSLRIKPMMVDEQFAPRPSYSACQFCPFKRSMGGPCPV